MDDIKNLITKLYSTNCVVGSTGKVFGQLGALSTMGNLNSIEQLMRQHQPQRTLEVGMAFGGSAVVFAAMHQTNSPAGSRMHLAIDPFQSTVWDDVGKMKLQEAQLTHLVEIIEDRSSIALPRLLSEGRRFGMIYIDGSHLFEDVFIDAYFGSRLLEEGGHLLFDDSTDPHVAKVLAFINASISGLKRETELTLKQMIARQVGRRQLTIYRRIGPVEREWNAKFDRF